MPITADRRRLGPPTTAGGPALPRRWTRQLREMLGPDDWRRIKVMFSAVGMLHVLGIGTFCLFVIPDHDKGLGIGVGVTAYVLGLRHAFDADHIAAIDTTTRKLLNERRGVPGARRPLSVGFWFSLGHSSVVLALGAGMVIAEKVVYGAVSNDHSGLERFGGVVGTAVSASFLYLLALLNVVILAGILKAIGALRGGTLDEVELERRLDNRGLMNRLFGRWMKSISSEWHLYPVGAVFGLGFDTATEVALLATTALLATQALPWYSILSLPVLFMAGMTLMDTIDGCFMNGVYGWAFLSPVRKVFYNLTVTGLSVAVCVVVATIEVLGLLPSELHLHGGFWDTMAHFDMNTAGLVIVALFAVTWVGALAVWKHARIEERWTRSEPFLAGKSGQSLRNPAENER